MKRLGMVGAALLLGTTAAMATETLPGELDTTFGTNGAVVLAAEPGGTVFQPQSMGVQSDGSVVVVSVVGTSWALRRYDVDGALDTSFGDDGSVYVLGSLDHKAGGLGHVRIDADDRIYVGGTVDRLVSQTKKKKQIIYNYEKNLGVVRLTADGALDSSFGTGGVSVAAALAISPHNACMDLDAGGRVVLGARVPAATGTVGLARFEGDGTLDDDFGTGGTSLVACTGIASLRDLSTDSSDRILLLVDTSVGTSRTAALARVAASGAADSTFPYRDVGDDAAVDYVVAYNVEADASDRPLASVFLLDPSAHIALLRYEEDGDVDDTFGTDGVAHGYGDHDGAWPAGLSVQSDGKIVVGAQVDLNFTSARRDYASALRFTDGGDLDADFGDAGMATPWRDPDLSTGSLSVKGVQVTGGRIFVGVSGSNAGWRALLAYDGD
jgi:uncharacterized delta-60 repeat protein